MGLNVDLGLLLLRCRSWFESSQSESSADFSCRPVVPSTAGLCQLFEEPRRGETHAPHYAKLPQNLRENVSGSGKGQMLVLGRSVIIWLRESLGKEASSSMHGETRRELRDIDVFISIHARNSLGCMSTSSFQLLPGEQGKEASLSFRWFSSE